MPRDYAVRPRRPRHFANSLALAITVENIRAPYLGERYVSEFEKDGQWGWPRF